MVPRLPPRAGRTIFALLTRVFNMDWKASSANEQHQLGMKFKEEWDVNRTSDLRRLPSMKRVFHHPPRPEKPTMWRSLAELENSPGFERSAPARVSAAARMSMKMVD